MSERKDEGKGRQTKMNNSHLKTVGEVKEKGGLPDLDTTNGKPLQPQGDKHGNENVELKANKTRQNFLFIFIVPCFCKPSLQLLFIVLLV